MLGQVLIAKPYRVEDCKAGKEVQVQMVQRIKKVVSDSSSSSSISTFLSLALLV